MADSNTVSGKQGWLDFGPMIEVRLDCVGSVYCQGGGRSFSPSGFWAGEKHD